MPLRLADVPVPAFRRGAVTALLLAVTAGLFWVMVAEVLLAALLGAVVGAYLRPLYGRLRTWTGRPALAATVALAALLVPVLVVLGYGYVELRGAAAYLVENAEPVARQIAEAAAALPFLDGRYGDPLAATLRRVGEAATGVPAGLQDAVGAVGVAVAVFLFTAFYLLTRAEDVVGYLRDKVPARYAGLTERLERNARGVLYGAVYATLVTQSLKGLWILTLMLVFGVPIPFTLALVAFVIGFFPVVGSWTVYVPAAGYLLVFEDAPVKAAALVAVAFVVSTPVLSFYVRPKLAADRSQVLDFYWMFIGLVAGVYTFGIPGVVLGPLVIGVGKALLDVVADDESWEPPDTDGDPHQPTVLVEEEMRG